METSLLLLALSKTLPESCLQGLLAYLALQLLFALFKKSTPALRFNLYYVATLLLFLGFLFTFFTHYQESKHTIFTGVFLSDTSITHPIIAAASKPNLWLRLRYFTNHYAYTISSSYLIGLIFCVLRLILGLINISWFKKSRHLQLESKLSAQVEKLCTHFNLLKTVSVFLSEKIQVPLTIGFFKPIIVFPIALINQLSTEQTEAILLHELAHIKRNDYLLNIVLSIIQSFLFFNPIIWLLSREINKYREQCCDDLVLDKTEHQLAYALALLLIEENRSAQLTLSLASNGKKYTLLNRIKRITNMKTNDPSPQNKLIIMLLAIATIGISVAWNMPVKKALKHLPVTNFKAVKEASISSKTDKPADSILIVRPVGSTMLHSNHKPVKQLIFIDKRSIANTIADTIIQSGKKFHIVMEDEKGNKKEYNSVEELPTDAQREFLKQNARLNKLQNFNFDFKFPDSNKFVFNNKFYSNPQWKKQTEEMRKQGEEIRKYYNSPEWKKQMADIKIQGEEIRKQFNSPEWKKQMANIRKQGEEIRKQFNSPEWKKQMADIRKQGEDIKRQFNSPEWKKQMEESTKKSIDSIRKNWKNSNDYPPKRIVVPQKQLEPEKL